MMKELKSQKRQFLVILTIVFLGFIGISIPYLIFPPMFLNPEYVFLPVGWGESSRAIFLGITLAAYPLGQFIGSPILGTLSDDYGRKHLLSASLVVAAVCNLFTAIAIDGQSLWLLIMSRFIAGLMEGNIAIARAMCADLKLLSKHKTFGKANASISVAYLIGPFIGGLLSDKELWSGLTTATPFFFVSVLFLVLACFSAIVLKKAQPMGSDKNKTLWQRINIVRRVAVLFSDKRLKMLLIASTCFTLAVDIFYEFGPVYLTLQWLLGPAQLTLYNGALCIGLAIGNGWLSGFIAPRVTPRKVIPVSIIGFALLLSAIVLTESASLMVVWFGVIGLAIGLTVTLFTVKISDSASDAMQGEVMGTQLSLRVLGDGIICLFGGVLLILSPKIILVFAALLSLATLVYYHRKRTS